LGEQKKIKFKYLIFYPYSTRPKAKAKG